MSFATGCVITLVDVRILADLAMPSLPKCNSVIIPTRHSVAGCFPPISAPSHSLPEWLWNISISIAASVLKDILVSNFATNSRGAADSTPSVAPLRGATAGYHSGSWASTAGKSTYVRPVSNSNGEKGWHSWFSAPTNVSSLALREVSTSRRIVLISSSSRSAFQKLQNKEYCSISLTCASTAHSY
ncbi:hypothetical protein T06_10965 [Trichinella sp. T6]|nr:hypothetical protein T06_7666 [Trichinella sp. T6]KRX54643.1 hypothetical protein T06_10965 [Trichinella sp. T6]